MKNQIKDLLFKVGKRKRALTCMVRDGFRDRVLVMKGILKLNPGVQLFLIALVALIVSIFSPASGAALALAPIAIDIDTEGLEGEELKFMQNLKKRLKNINIPGKTEEELSKAISDAINKELKDFKGSMEKMAQVLDEKTGFVAMMQVIKNQGEEITALKAAGKRTDAPKSVREQVAEWVEKNKESIARAKAGDRSASLPALHIQKAAITMTESASLNASAYLPNPQVMPGVIDLVRVQPTFWDRLQKPATKANPLIWVNKYNPQGNATFIGEGTLKNLGSFELQTESSVPKKVAERMKISREMLDDIDYIAGLIETELRYQVDTKCNTEVLTGVASATNPKGVTQYAAAYTLITITGIIDPNESDCIRAAIAQLRSTNFNGPLTAFINPIDAAKMDLQKTSQGAYVLPPFQTADGRNIAATPIVEDNNIAVGYLLLGDMSKYHVQMYQDFFIEWGYENDDFTKNLVTVIGERRFHQWVSGNETGAFVYDTFANIKTAIA